MNPVETLEPGRALKAQKAWEFLSGAFVFSIPFMAGVNSTLVILLLVLWFFLPKRIDWSEHGLLMLAAAMPFWLAAVGLSYTDNVDEGFFRLQQKALLLLLPLLFFTIRVDLARLTRTMVSLFVLGVAMACLVSLSAAFYCWRQTGSPEYFVGHGLARFLDLYPYVFALLCLVSLIVLAEAERGAVSVYPMLGRKPRVGLGLLLIGFLLLLAVQQVIMIWGLLTIVYTWKVLRLGRWVIMVTLSLAALFAIGVATVPPLNEKVNDILSGSSRNTIPLDFDGPMQQEWNGIAVRKAIWTCAGDLIRENPFFGVGTGDGQDALQQAYARRKFHLAAMYNRYNAHNQYLQTIVCSGVAGLMLWLVSISWILWRFRHESLFLFAFIPVLLSMLTESMLETNKGNLLYSFVVVLGIVYARVHAKVSS
jgi:O-antigen ligase